MLCYVLGATIWFWGRGGLENFCRDRLYISSMSSTTKFIFRYTKARLFIFIRNKILKKQKKNQKNKQTKTKTHPHTRTHKTKRGGGSECWFRRVPGPGQDLPWDQGIKTSIFQSWPILRDLDANDCVLLPNKPDFINALCKDSKDCKTIYTIFVSKLYHKPKS